MTGPVVGTNERANGRWPAVFSALVILCVGAWFTGLATSVWLPEGQRPEDFRYSAGLPVSLQPRRIQRKHMLSPRRTAISAATGSSATGSPRCGRRVLGQARDHWASSAGHGFGLAPSQSHNGARCFPRSAAAEALRGPCESLPNPATCTRPRSSGTATSCHSEPEARSRPFRVGSRSREAGLTTIQDPRRGSTARRRPASWPVG